jgi:membrane protease YdiL (CAAX protease family)
MAAVDSSKRVLVRNRTEWRSVATYYAIACGVSWVLWSPLILGSDGLKLLEIAPPVPVLISIGTLGPLVACYVAHRLSDGNWRAVQFLPSHALQWLWTVVGPLLIVFCFFVVFPALISAGPLHTWRWRPSTLAGIVLPMFNYNILAGPLFEEFGWRGFLQSRLQRLMPTWIAAISVGALWAAWHLPLFILQGWTSASPLVYLLIVIGLSLVVAFGFNASGRSVLAAILMPLGV